jgi:hypothetical protein
LHNTWEDGKGKGCGGVRGQGRERRLEIRMRWPWKKVVEIAGHYFIHVLCQSPHHLTKYMKRRRQKE